jgi:hypothetical protein
MKKTKFFKLLMIFIICFSCIKNDDNSPANDDITPKNCEELKAQGIIDSFPYPIRPGSSAWAELTTQEAKYEAVTIPNSILQDMCTHGLVYTCVYCPFFQGYFIIYNTVRTGFLSLCKNINSFAELVERYDAAEELYAYYNTLFDTTWESIELSENRMQILMTEVFFAQQEFLTMFNEEEIKDVLISSYDILMEKELNNYSGIN